MKMLFNNITNIEMTLPTNDGLFTSIAGMLNISSKNTSGYLIYLLVMLGVLIIIAVLIYNWWEERRFNMEVESNFSPIENDVLLDKNKQEFLDKFAATTGYLNDEPADQSLAAAINEPLDETKSIEDVYKELLETMANKPAEIEGIDDDGKVTINHDTIEQHNIKPEISNSNAEQILYIPEEVTAGPESSQSSNIYNQGSITQNETPATETQNSIKDIINQAFNTNGQTIKIAESNATPVEASSVGEDAPSIEQTPPYYTDEQVAIDDAYTTDDQSEYTSVNVAQKGVSHETTEKEVPPMFAEEHAFKVQVASLDGVAKQQAEEDAVRKIRSFQSESSDNPPSNYFNKRKTDQPDNTARKDDAFMPSFASTLPPTLNSHMDLIGTLVIPQGATPEFLLETFSGFYKDYDKPVFLFSQTSADAWALLNNAELSTLAEVINPSQEVHITASIQMADRSGPISKNTVTRFQSSFESIANNLNLKVNWGDHEDPLYKASALDAFCIDVDKTMFFHLTGDGKGPFTGTKLKGLVEGQGMELAGNGHYQYFDVEANDQSQFRMPEFVMFNRDNHPFNPEMLRSSVVKAVTFQLDIPHINASGTALDRMVIIAKSLEDNLNVQLVDDQNRPLGTLHIDKIREQVKSIHATMQLRGITPGSEFAHRLFS